MKMRIPQIAVLIPCYNEENTIEKVVSDFKTFLPHADIYVYDNCSTDETARKAENAGAIVRKENMQGKGNVIRRMFREIDACCYILVDGDDTYPAENAEEMVNLVLNEQADMVIGDRLSSTYFTENKRPFHNIGNRLVRTSINHLFKNDIKDIMTGYRAFSYKFVKTFPVISKGFEIETEMTIHAVDKNMNIKNVIVDYRDRPEGSESKLNTFHDGMAVLRTIGSLWKNYKPFHFFGLLTFLLVIIDLAVFLPLVFIPYLQTGLVEKIPTLIFCGFVMIASLLAFFTGMILENIIRKEKREFEFRLQVIELLGGDKDEKVFSK